MKILEWFKGLFSKSEEYIEPTSHEDIEAARAAIEAIQEIDIAMYGGKRMEARIKRNVIILIDRHLQYLVECSDPAEEDEEPAE